MSLNKWFKNRRCSNADSNDLECQKQLKCHNLLTISLTCIQFALAAMSIGYVSLAAIESGEYSAPAEQASLFVANGPWPTGRKSFYRKKNESVEAWCAKVLLSARDTRSAVRFLLRHPRLPLDRLSIGSCVCAGNASRAACAPLAESSVFTVAACQQHARQQHARQRHTRQPRHSRRAAASQVSASTVHVHVSGLG